MPIAIATNEPWGTYHLAPYAAAAEQLGVELVQLCPDADHLPASTPVPVHLGPSVDADVLVISGLTAWPRACLEANPTLPVVASYLAYLNPSPAAGAEPAHRARISAVTAPGTADAAAFTHHLGVTLPVTLTGCAALDSPAVQRRRGHTLVMTSVTYPDETGGYAPGAELLQQAARVLAGAGHQVVVRPHPRERLELWADFELDRSPTPRDAAAGARLVVGIPGTAFGWLAADKVPLLGVVAPDLVVPAHLLAVCGALVAEPMADADVLTAAAAAQRAPDPVAVIACVGPVAGGVAARTIAAWAGAAASRRTGYGVSARFL